jgi:hypothetical protein
MHVTTKAIRSIIATVLENTLSAIYVVLSFSATTKKKKEQKLLDNSIHIGYRHDRDRMVVGFTTACAISGYHH